MHEQVPVRKHAEVDVSAVRVADHNDPNGAACLGRQRGAFDLHSRPVLHSRICVDIQTVGLRVGEGPGLGRHLERAAAAATHAGARTAAQPAIHQGISEGAAATTCRHRTVVRSHSSVLVFVKQPSPTTGFSIYLNPRAGQYGLRDRYRGRAPSLAGVG